MHKRYKTTHRPSAPCARSNAALFRGDASLSAPLRPFFRDPLAVGRGGPFNEHPMMPYVSIIIPARNDADALKRTLDHLCALPGIRTAEAIVAASGDPVGTMGAVAGRTRLLWPPGPARATLMNAGAAAARGEVLFFRARYRLTRNYYGDQGIFVRAALFREMGGYKDLEVLEDLDFTQRLKRRGRSVLIPVPLHTSGRRLLARGPWRTFFFIVWLLFLHTLRLDTQRYAEQYRGPADRPPGSPWPGRVLTQPRG